nr:YbaN family protein [Anaerocolumna cellulosilytica]
MEEIVVKYNPVKVLYIVAGFLALGLGALGVVLPVLPTTPFLLVASFCFAKGSARFHTWFCSTRLYKNHLDSFVKSRAMTRKTKIRILIPASAMLILAFIFMPSVHGRIAIGVVMCFKYYYFIFRIKTIPVDKLKGTEDLT